MRRRSALARASRLGSLAAILLLAGTRMAPVAGITVAVTGDWQGSVGAAELIGGAGSDFAPVESSDTQVRIDISNTSSGWRLDIRRSDSWPSGMRLEIRRQGQTDWHEITTLDTLFLEGAGELTGVYCRLRIRPTASAGAGTFATTVTYTVVEQ